MQGLERYIDRKKTFLAFKDRPRKTLVHSPTVIKSKCLTCHPVETRNAVKLFLGGGGRCGLKKKRERKSCVFDGPWGEEFCVGGRACADGLFGRAPRSPRSIRLRLAPRGNSPLVGPAAGSRRQATFPPSGWKVRKRANWTCFLNSLAMSPGTSDVHLNYHVD